MYPRLPAENYYRSSTGGRRLKPAVFLCTLLSLTASAQTTLQTGVVYACGTTGRNFKVYSCSGTDAAATCDMQAYLGTQAGPRAPVPRAQVEALTQVCQPLKPGQAPPAAAAPASMPGAMEGIKVGDAVEVVTAQGWTSGAKVTGIQGPNYRVDINGIQVTKTFPAEIRRAGKLLASDHAAGQYVLHDRVQVNFQGQWIDSQVVGTLGMEYQVELPGNRTAWAKPENLRWRGDAPPPAPPKTGVAPKPGMVNCAGKIEGRYASTGGFGSLQITFRSGKATMGGGFGGDETLECWVSGDKIILHKPGDSPDQDMPIDINSDGTLQTPLGEIKKKGN